MSAAARQTVTAVTRQGQTWQAVQGRRRGDRVEILWARHRQGAEGTGESFAAQCDLLSGRDTGKGAAGRVVVGIESTGLWVTTLAIPDCSDDDTEALVAHQVESHWPLPLEQVEWVWQRRQTESGGVLVAAARKHVLQGRRRAWCPLEPDGVFLHAEALAALARLALDRPLDTGVLIHLNDDTTDLCRLQRGCLMEATVVDLGLRDLRSESPGSVARWARQVTAALERWRAPEEDRVLWDPTASGPVLGEALGRWGCTVRTARFDGARLALTDAVDPDALVVCRVALGLLLLDLERPPEPVDWSLVQRHGGPQRTEPAGTAGGASWVWPLGALLLSLAAWAGASILSLSWQRELLERLAADPAVQSHLALQAARKAVARSRPELLAVLQQLNGVEVGDLVLHDFVYRRGQRIRVTGQAKKAASVYAFETRLNDCPDISRTEIESMHQDDKRKTVSFTLTFDYPGFAQATTRSGRR